MNRVEGTAERHVSWLELFFDLVVVVAVDQLAHLLHGAGHDGPAGLAIAMFFAMYLAIWLVWTTFTLYSNVLAERVRQPAMFLGMAGIATMAAAVPEVMDGRSGVFAAAYLATSAVGSAAFTRSGRILLSWNAATRNAGLVPWLVAFWVHDPWWKLALWSLGLGMTLWSSIVSERQDGDKLLASLNERLSRRTRRDRGDERAEPAARPTLVAAKIHGAHLDERLGLFVIIVLGEAMLQLVGAVAAIEDWWPGGGHGVVLLLTAAAGFFLLIMLWWLNVQYGFAEEARIPPGLELPAHFAAIAAITTIATGLGTAASASSEHLPAATAWLTCAGATAYLLVITMLTRDTRRWVLSAAMIALPLLTAPFAAVLPAAVVVAALLVASAALGWNLRRPGTR
ncbi:MAG: low temperature requirement protein A [Labedaea sp.]